MKDYSKHWEVIKENLGSGGQGVVKLVRAKFGRGILNKNIELNNFSGDILSRLVGVLEVTQKPKENDYLEISRLSGVAEECIKIISEIANPTLGALKILKEPPRNEAAPNRMKREIEIGLNFNHPNLIPILDHDDENFSWYVCKYFARGSLEKSVIYTGRVKETLEAVKPAIEAVSLLHENNTVHRDIKPGNIFIADNDQLILADPGLALSEAAERYTQTREVAASWEWAPEWVQRGRVPEIDKTHDVFSLVKLIWAMIAGALAKDSKRPLMRLWKWDDPEYDLREQFTKQPREMQLISELFQDVIVEKRHDCQITDAPELLRRVSDLMVLTENVKSSFVFFPGDNPLRPLEEQELTSAFEIKTQDSVSLLRRGYRCYGDSKNSKSTIALKDKVSEPFAISINVDATKHESKSVCWRVGFKVQGQNNDKNSVCHIDNHNLIVGYLNKRNVLSVPCAIDFSNNKVNLRLDVSHEIDSTNKRLFFCVNGSSYYIGELEQPGDYLILSLEVWSDQGKKHDIIIHDIRITKAFGISYTNGKTRKRLIK